MSCEMKVKEGTAYLLVLSKPLQIPNTKSFI